MTQTKIPFGKLTKAKVIIFYLFTIYKDEYLNNYINIDHTNQSNSNLISYNRKKKNIKLNILNILVNLKKKILSNFYFIFKLKIMPNTYINYYILFILISIKVVAITVIYNMNHF